MFYHRNGIMLKTKNKLIIILSIVWSLIVTPSLAEVIVGEGYADPSFRELYQTMVGMGGIDVNNPLLLTEYIKLTECELFEKYYKNDIKWNDISREIYSNIVDRKENYRVMYEFTERLALDRYNFDKEYFDIKSRSQMKNVGTILLSTHSDFQSYCYAHDDDTRFTSNIVLLLSTPLNITRLTVPVDRVEPFLRTVDKLKVSPRDEEDGDNKYIYTRVRFRVLDTPGLYFDDKEPEKFQAYRAEIRGAIKAIDFFYDQDFTKPIDFIEINQEE